MKTAARVRASTLPALGSSPALSVFRTSLSDFNEQKKRLFSSVKLLKISVRVLTRRTFLTENVKLYSPTKRQNPIENKTGINLEILALVTLQ